MRCVRFRNLVVFPPMMMEVKTKLTSLSWRLYASTDWLPEHKSKSSDAAHKCSRASAPLRHLHPCLDLRRPGKPEPTNQRQSGVGQAGPPARPCSRPPPWTSRCWKEGRSSAMDPSGTTSSSSSSTQRTCSLSKRCTPPPGLAGKATGESPGAAWDPDSPGGDRACLAAGDGRPGDHPELYNFGDRVRDTSQWCYSTAGWCSCKSAKEKENTVIFKMMENGFAETRLFSHPGYFYILTQQQTVPNTLLLYRN